MPTLEGVILLPDFTLALCRNEMIAVTLAHGEEDGTRPRNVMWHPRQNGNRNSNTSPYIWASGSMLTIPSPGFRKSIFSKANSMLPERLP